MKKILLVGGGTGGHMMPLLPISAEAKKNKWEPFFLFSEGPVERKIYKQNFSDFEVTFIRTEKIRRYLSWKNLLVPFLLMRSFWQTVKILRQINPDVVFLKGSAISFNALLAVKFINIRRKIKIKIFAHESDTSPSLSMKWCTRWADKVFASFGKPMRPLFYEQVRHFESLIVRANFFEEVSKKQNTKSNILIFGGSQGALFLNQQIERNLESLLQDYNVVLVTGEGKKIVETKYFSSYVEGAASSKKLGIFQQFELLPAAEFDHTLDQADLVICRSGASVFQVLSRKKKSLLVPYPYAARDHQLKNAQFFAEKNLAYLLTEKKLRADSALFLAQIKKISADKNLTERLNKSDIKNSAREIFVEMMAVV
jgi:UDP-N-acetylglucosamine--N-acetylmuramyl-(pentapeptide) pyrophosphoryl-undecaprenol N-acetylglucosamine transferase